MARLAGGQKVSAGRPGGGRGPGPGGGDPIMRWLHDLDGPIDEFNQTVVLRPPAGVGQADVETVLQAVLDRHATLRLAGRPTTAPAAGRSTPEAGSVPAGDCIESVSALSAEALAAAVRGSTLPPVMLHALGARYQSAGAGHPSPRGRRGVVANPVEDVNIAWAQHNAGQLIALPTGDVVRPLVGAILRRAHAPGPSPPGRHVAADRPAPAVLPAVQPERDTYASAGRSLAEAGCRAHPPGDRWCPRRSTPGRRTSC